MTTGGTIRLVLQGLVFLLWAAMMFRMLFTVTQRSRDNGGPDIPTVGGFTGQLSHWLRSEEDKSERKTLFFLTFVLIAMSLTNALAAAQPTE
ncbi:hypothetical protein [Jannaschia sp. CCS1]|uniref:hypothetical protein n=1 Tax=Jannaschia sp. (strain CCS1) TaxID=290400 RepID=UPI000053C7F9|nr:hypothetical protein [Jannaschia sp. CCS1]ABD56940.1 hypothetical protein Jann_4023 [Jannaschia sp. CCS1]